MDDVHRQLAPHLLTGEHLLWTGRPDPTKHFAQSDVVLVPFSLLWTGFAIFWMGAALAGGASMLFALFGLPFVLLGLYFVCGRFWTKAHRKRQTAYGLTERRALVAIGSGWLSDAPVVDQQVDQRRSRDGKHLSVTFGRPAPGWPAGPSVANTGMDIFQQGGQPLGFYDVADADGLQSALRRLRG